MNTICAWIEPDGRVVKDESSYAHNHCDLYEYLEGDIRDHEEAFNAGVLRVFAEDSFLAAQWAGKLTAAQKSEVKRLLGGKEELRVAGSNEGYDPEDDSDCYHPINLLASNGKRLANAALTRKMSDNWREEY